MKRERPSFTAEPVRPDRGRARLAFALLILAWVATPALAERLTPAEPTSFDELQVSWERHRELEESSPFHGLRWRDVGPVVQGGRVVDLESVPGEPYTFYVAYASGGIWRTRDNGVTFDPLSDRMPTMIVGDMALDPRRPETLWVGTGENNSSRSSYGGMGVFRSDDAGETWRHMGLGETDRIGAVLVDPERSERIWVASLGKLYTPGGQRGVFRSDDGGETWNHVLAFDDPWTGVVDLVMHPEDPRTLYAAAWERSRRPWNFVEGGPGSGVWKSTDGGETWARLEGGLPRGEHVGRIGLAIAPSQPSTLYVSLDNQEPLPEEEWDLGGGAVTAKRIRGMSKEEFLAQDPEEIEDFIRGNDLDTSLDAARLIEMVREDEITLERLLEELDDANASLFQTDIRGLELWRSDDAGATFRRTHEQPIREVVYTYGYYFGEVRVAPKDPERIYLLGVPLITSADGGKSFSGLNGRDVHVDHQEFWIDPNHPERMITGNDGGLDISYDGGKSWLKLDAQSVGQFYTVEVDMEDPYNIYGGLQDNGVLMGPSTWRAGLSRPWRRIGGGDGMYIQADPRDSSTVYLGLQFGFYRRIDAKGGGSIRPRDGLDEPALRYNWNTPILLSDHDPDTLYFGANRLFRSLDRGETWTAISPDLTHSEERGDVPFATLTTLAESPLAFGLLWAGTDDGILHVSDDGGVEWRDASQGLPRDRWISRVEASRYKKERAYVSLNGYRDDDHRAYVYRSEDLGLTWTDISAGLPAEAINVVREDPVNEEVLYVGTDRGVYVSQDRGGGWMALDSGLPNVPVHDLIVHPRERELVAGTHGRSVWVVDVLPVQELTPEVRDTTLTVFPVEEVSYRRFWRQRRSPWFHRPEDDPRIQIPFWSAAEGEAQLVVEDAQGRPLARRDLEVRPGINTIEWDLLLDEAAALAAEEARLAAATESEDGKAKKKKRKKKSQAEEPPKLEEGALAGRPWSEALRLGRPLYVTPGTYALKVVLGEAEAATELTVKAPEPRRPRAKKEEPIRGRKQD